MSEKIFNYSEFYSFLKNNDIVVDSCSCFVDSVNRLENECCQKRNKRAEVIRQFKLIRLTEKDAELIKKTLQVDRFKLIYGDTVIFG